MIDSIYRPHWTYGKYNVEHHVAILYDMILGKSYFFEDISADLIGLLIKERRGTKILSKELAYKLGVNIEELSSFLQELISINLLCLDYPDKSVSDNYRRLCSAIDRTPGILPSVVSDLSITPSDDAETLYANAIGGITSVMLELTYRCSEQCIHCYNFGASHCDSEVSKRGSLDELTLTDYYKLIDDLDAAGVFRVTISGGDPFSKVEIWDILSRLYEKEITFDIYTNGQNLLGKEDKLAFLYPKLVGVSIYSGIPSIHDTITRVKGSFDKSVKVLEHLSSLSVPLYVKCCVMRTNFDSYNSVFDLAKKVNAIPQIEINIVDSIDGNKYVSTNLRLNSEQPESLLDDVRTLQAIDISSDDILSWKRNMNENACRAGFNTFNITPDGDLVPCCSFHLPFGNSSDAIN